MSTSHSPEPSTAPAAVPGDAEPGVAGVLALYVLARAGLLAVIAGLLALAGTPVVISFLVALVVALPLSMVLFRGLRARLEVALTHARARRGAQRAALRAGLRGDAGDAEPGDAADHFPDGSGDRAEGQPDGGRG